MNTEVSLHLTIRPWRPSDAAMLPELLYQAIFVPPGAQPPPRSVLRQPQIAAYIDGFGTRVGDVCFVAERTGTVMGAAWCRLWAGAPRGYGFVDADTPELSVSLLPAARGRGAGTRLVQTLMQEEYRQGYARLSLSVSRENPAVRLYRRLGFVAVREEPDDFVMVAALPGLF